MQKSRVRLGSHLWAENSKSPRPNKKNYSKIIGLIVIVVLIVAGIKAFDGNNGPEISNVPEEKAVLGAQDVKIDPNQDYVYEVQEKDSLFSISERYQVNWEEIVKLNNLVEPYLLRPGQEIKLPTSQVTKSQQFYENLKNKIYVVEEGDTFVSIAQKLNVSITDLLRANPDLDSPDFISIGQVLQVP